MISERANPVRVRHGLPNDRLEAAARLYWQAFGGKLGRILGPEERAIRFLCRAIRRDHCLYVTDASGQLIGIAGFKSPEGGFAGGTKEDLRAIYGRFGAMWRMTLFQMLLDDEDNVRFLVDGICVAREWRGQGVGRALLEGLIAEARWRGYPAIRLEVIEDNVRARALYERMGFSTARTESIGLLRLVFGFRRAMIMVLHLPAPSPQISDTAILSD